MIAANRAYEDYRATGHDKTGRRFITNTPGDFSNLDPMISATLEELERVGITERPEVALADAQYWNEQHMDEVIATKHIQVLIRPDSSGRKTPRPGWTDGRYSWMRTVLTAEHGKGLYRKRMQMIEPVFAHTKHNRLITRFHRRSIQSFRKPETPPALVRAQSAS